MSSKKKVVYQLLAECIVYGLKGMDFVVSLPIDDIVKAYNGIGPSWFPEKLREAIDKLDPVLRPIALPHDCMFTYNDGSREWFDKANNELEENGLALADAKFAWYNPRRYLTRYRALTYAMLCRKYGWEAYTSDKMSKKA